MKFFRIYQKTILFIYCLFKHRSIRLSYNLAFYNATLENINLVKKVGNFILFPNKNAINIDILYKFDFSINLLFKLINNINVKVEDTNSSFFIISTNGLKFKVTSLSNMAVLYEIFIQKLYEVGLNHKNLVVIDIGMNVGVASLYFANQNSIEAVYGYEPFPDTYKEALDNFNLNPTLTHKINSFNLGVSNTTCSRTISLFDSGLLSASTIETTDIYGKVANKKVEVNLISIIDLLKKVTMLYPNNRILLKIDCEGEEYAIFDSIKNTKYLDQVDCILLEWHEKGIEQISSFLLDSGFQYFHMPNESFNSGMMYAFRLN